MMRFAAIASCLALTATAATAESLPVFDETRGFDVMGVIEGTHMLVRNGGTYFACGVEENGDATYVMLTDCAPIIGPQAALEYETTTVQAQEQAVEDFLSTVGRMPEGLMAQIIGESLATFPDCSVDVRDEEALGRVVATKLAARTGFDGLLTQDIIEEVLSIGDSAAEMLLESGLVLLDRDLGIARLADCPQ